MLGTIGGAFKTVAPLANFLGNVIGGSKARQQAQDDAERNRQFQREERLATQQWQEDMMHKQNDLSRSNQEWSYKNFDSMNAQRMSAETAGINPFVTGSPLQAGISSAMPASSPPSGNPSPGSMPSSKKYEAQMMMAGAVGQAALLQSEIDLKKAQAANVNADTKQKQGNTLDPALTLRLQELGVSLKSSEAIVANVKAEFARQREQAEVANIEQTFKHIEASTKELLAREGLNRANIEKVWSEINVNMSKSANLDEQTTDLQETRDARIRKLSSDSDLNDANRKRIESLTQAELAELWSKVDESYQRRKSMNRDDARKAIDIILRDMGFIPAGGMPVIGEVRAFVRSIRTVAGGWFGSEKVEDNLRKIQELTKIAFDIDTL